MAKTAIKYLRTEPFGITEEGFHKERSQVSESLFSLANEYMGVRGSFEEATASLKTLRGTYFNGIYDYSKDETPNAYKGIAKKTHFMLNAVDFFRMEIEADGYKLDLGEAAISHFMRHLDFLSGLSTRSFVWHLPDGKDISIIFERFLSLVDCHNAYQRVTFISAKPVDMKIGFVLDTDTVQWGKDRYFITETNKSIRNVQLIREKTITTDFEIACAASVISLQRPCDNPSTKDQSVIGYSFRLQGKESFTKFITTHTSREADMLRGTALEEAVYAENKQQVDQGLESALNKNKKFFADLFARSDIQIKGSEEDQQGIRFCIFMLATTYHGFANADNIGAKGLTGEAYSGHTFWDTETYCLPFYLFNNAEAARNLLSFRYRTLPQAINRARELDCSGACFPVATLNGEEGCTLWQHASLQFQPSTGVAYAIHHYQQLTGDIDYMYREGLELLLEISKFLLTRGQYDQSGRRFGFYAVMGPDEFKMMVNNNAYTNLMAKMTFEYTLENIKNLKDTARVQAILDKCGVTNELLDRFAGAARDMIISFSHRTGLYEENEGFFKLPHIDITAIPSTDFPLYDHWSYDRIYRGDMIKQPDVLMYIFLFLSRIPLKVKKANFDYYEPRCIHESSLSPSIHSILAEDLGRDEMALDFFAFASRLDLDDYNRNTDSGLHMTSLAAAWMNILYGFGGLRSDGKILSLNPRLPSRWHQYSFHLTYRGSLLSVTVTAKGVTIENAGQPVRIKIYGNTRTLSGKKTFVK